MIQIWLKRQQLLRNTYFPSRNISLSSSFRLLLLYIFNDGQCLIWRERDTERLKKGRREQIGKKEVREGGREGGRKEGKDGERRMKGNKSIMRPECAVSLRGER